MTQEENVATADANYSTAKMDYDVNDSLAKVGLVPSLTLKQSKVKAEQLAKLLEIEQNRLESSGETTKALLVVQEEKVAQARAQLAMKQRLASGLKICA